MNPQFIERGPTHFSWLQFPVDYARPLGISHSGVSHTGVASLDTVPGRDQTQLKPSALVQAAMSSLGLREL